MTVLIVDVDEKILECTAQHLSQHYNTFRAQSLEQAQHVLKEAKVDLVLTNAHLDGEMEGLKLVKWIKLYYYRVPIIVLVLNLDQSTLLQCLRSGAIDVLNLPLSFAELDQAIVRAIEKINLETEIWNTQLERLNSSKLSDLEVMAGGIAHEINNPMAIIRGYANKIKRLYINKEKQNIDESTLGYIEIILKTTQRIDKIIKGIRSFTSDSIREKFEKVPLSKIIEETLFLCETKIKSKDIALNIAPPPNIHIECKPTQLTQVLFNLITNSVDAIKSLEDKWVQINFSVTSEMLEIQIIDSGQGIEDKIIHKMFEPFFTTKDPNKGTGLGLAICKSIVEAHQGLLEYSTNNANTTFIIYVPISQTINGLD